MESSSAPSNISEIHNLTPKSLDQVPDKGKNENGHVDRIPILFLSCNIFASYRKRPNFEAKQIQSLLSTEISFYSRICAETTFTSRKGSTCKNEHLFNHALFNLF